MTAQDVANELRFPGAICVGKVYLRREHSPWSFHASARGVVAIPPGCEVRLRLDDRFMAVQTSLGELHPGRVEYLDVADLAITDSTVEGLDKWEGLRALSLARTRITDKALSIIGGLAELAALDLDHTLVGTRGMEELGNLAELKSLILTGCPVDNECLAPILRMKQLEALRLGGTAVSTEGVQMLGVLSSLRELELNTHTTDEGLEILPQLGGLISLWLTECLLSDEAMKQVAHLGGLKLLALPVHVSYTGLELLAGKLEQLETLWLSAPELTPEEVRILTRFPSLKRLYSPGILVPEAAWHLGDLPVLESLCLTHESLSFDVLNQLERCRKLAELRLAPMTLKSSELGLFTQIQNLGRLHLYKSSVSSEAFRWLKGAMSQTEITHAPRLVRMEKNFLEGSLLIRHMSNDGVGPWQPIVYTEKGYMIPLDAEISYRSSSGWASDLEWVQNSESINLVEIRVTGARISLELGIEIARLNSLRSLELPHCDVAPGGWEKIGAGRNITKLVIDFTNIDDEGVADLVSLESLEEFEARGTAITDDSLEALIGMKTLKVVRLEGSKVTAEGRRMFAEARPDVQLT